MAILFTEGFGGYGAIGAIAGSGRMGEKWDTATASLDYEVLADGRHAGTVDKALYMVADNNTALTKIHTLVSGTVVIVGFAYRDSGTNATFPNFIEVRDSAGIIASLDTTAGTSIRVKGTSQSVLLTLANALEPYVWHHFELKVDGAYTGTIQVRRDGVVIGTVANDNTARIPDRTKIIGSIYGRYFQDIYIADTSGPAPQNGYLGDVRIETLFPTTQGANTAWTFVHPNRLTLNQASLETDITGWTVDLACTIARTTAQAKYGAASLEMTCGNGTTTSAITPTGTAGIPVVAGLTYAARSESRPAITTLRNSTVGIRWYSSAGAVISTTTGNQQIETANTWARAAVVSGVAPTGAAFAAVVLTILGPPNIGEVHYFDGMQFSLARADQFILPSSDHADAVRESPSDANAGYISSDTVGVKETFVFEDLVTVNGTIMSVRPNLDLNRQAVGIRTVGALARVGSTDYDSSGTVSPDSSVNVQKLRQIDIPLNPATGLPWTIAIVNAAEFGVKIVT